MHYIAAFFLLAFPTWSSGNLEQFTNIHSIVPGDTSTFNIDGDKNKIALNEITAGVLTLKQQPKGTISIFNQNNQPTLSIKLDGELNETISPYSGFLEYEILVFRVVRSDSIYHHVIINEQTGAMGKIKKSESLLKYQQWGEHVLNVFSVDFDPAKNPLRKDTSTGSKSVYDNNVEFYHPAQISGDWLKLKWDTEKGQRFGWIRWKKGRTLLVDLNYIP